MGSQTLGLSYILQSQQQMQPGIFSFKDFFGCKYQASSSLGSLTEPSLPYLLQCYSVKYIVSLNTVAGFTTDQNLLSKVSGIPGVQLRLSIGLTCTKGG